MMVPGSRLRGFRFPAIPGPAAARVLAVLYQLERSQWLPAGELLALQLSQLGAVLRHARRHVPHYRRLLDGQRLDPAEPPTLEFLRALPILGRTAIQDAGPDLHAETVPGDHGKISRAQTSGSTGRPVRFLRTEATRFMWSAFTLRDHAWHDRDFTQKAAAIRWISGPRARRGVGLKLGDWGSTVRGVYRSAPVVALHVATPLAEQIAWLQREQPVSLVSFPSNLAAIAAECLRRGIEMPSIRELRTVGETLSESQRELMRRAWNARITDFYTCEETGYLALQCPVSDNYHVQSENVLLEIVDADGRPCPPGTPGRVLVTGLHNFAMPLVRYELGDMAEPGEPCPCGRGLPVLRRILGRTRNRVLLPDGRSEFPYLGEHGETEALTGVQVRQYQCIQHSLEEIEVRLVADRAFTPAEAATSERRLQEHLGHPFRIRYSFVDDIPRGPTGKYEEFICRVPAPATG